MEFQRIGVWLLDSLEDIEDDTGETFFVEIDFLVVGYLTDLAILSISGVKRRSVAISLGIPDVGES